jgi:hypothetical protein
VTCGRLSHSQLGNSGGEVLTADTLTVDQGLFLRSAEVTSGKVARRPREPLR